MTQVSSPGGRPVANPGSPPVVAHVVNSYLFRTGTWIHTQITGMERFRPIVLTKRRENEEEFLFDPIFCFASLPPLRRLIESGLRRLTGRRIWPVYRRWLAREKASVVHAHFGPVGWEIAEECRALGIPLVTTFYGYDVGRLGREALWRERYRELFEAGTRFLVEGPFFGRAVEKLGCPPEKITVQHLGVDVERLLPRESVGPEPVRVAFCGSFREKKGLPDAVGAFAAVADRHPRVRLEIVGTASTDADRGEEAKARSLVSEHGLEERVAFLGGMPYAEYLAFLREADVLLAPSRVASDGDSEGGAPVTLIEAQAMGVPVVSTTHCDIPEVIQDEQGCLVPEGDVDALADRLDRVLGDRDLRIAFGRAGRHHVEQEFDRRALAGRLEEIYGSLLR